MRRLSFVIALVLLISANAFAEIRYSVQLLSEMGVCDGEYGAPAKINSSGTVLGSAIHGNGRLEAFVWRAPGDYTFLGKYGVDITVGRDINDAEQMIIMAYEYGVRSQGYLINADGSHHELTQPGTSWVDLCAISNSGTTVVGARSTGYQNQACIWSNVPADTLSTDLPTLAGSAWNINDSGQIVGDRSGHVVMWDGDTVVDIPNDPKAVSMSSVAINDSSQILANTGNNAFLYGRDRWTEILPSSNTSGVTHAYGLNNVGQVVGVLDTKAFVWYGGTLQYLDGLIDPTLNLRLVYGYDINDSGQIIALNYDGRLAVLTPTSVPEPSSVVAVLCGLGTLAGAVLRKRR